MHAGLRVPSRARLEVLCRQLDDPGAQRAGVGIEDREVRRYRDALHLVPLRAAPAPLDLTVEGPGVWQLETGRLTIREGLGAGLDQRRCGRRLRLTWRTDGLRCRPAGRGGSASLKQLFQEHGVPPWCRDRLPLVHVDDQLVAVADPEVPEAGERATRFTAGPARSPHPTLFGHNSQ